MIRIFLIAAFICSVVVVAVFGFRGQKSTYTPFEIFNDMDHQAKVKSQKPSQFFADGKGDRLPVKGAVPMGFAIPENPRQAAPDQISESVPWSNQPYSFAVGDDYYNTGKIGNVWGDGIPVPVTPELLARGKERYAINCAICHGDSGNGLGVVAQYAGYLNLVASYHQDRLRQAPDGNIYNTIAYGKGLMYGYAENISVNDRWAIVAYLRLLQKSQNVVAASLPEDVRARIKE
jgi:mono/diheme cytochrome c family protein